MRRGTFNLVYYIRQLPIDLQQQKNDLNKTEHIEIGLKYFSVYQKQYLTAFIYMVFDLKTTFIIARTITLE